MPPARTARNPRAARSKAVCVRVAWPVGRPGSLVLDLQATWADIDLQALRFLLGLVEIVAEHADRDDQCADDEIHDIAVGGHSASPWLAGILLAIARF